MYVPTQIATERRDAAQEPAYHPFDVAVLGRDELRQGYRFGDKSHEDPTLCQRLRVLGSELA